MRNLDYMKPVRFQNHVTLTELSRIVDRDISRIRRLEEEGRLPRASRYRVGQLEVRLWSPEQVEEIKEVFANMKPGRPRNV